jgi:hypothetical protein
MSSRPVALFFTARNSAPVVGAVAGSVEVIGDKPVGAGKERQIAHLAAFAGHFEMRHAFARMPEIPDLELAELLRLAVPGRPLRGDKRHSIGRDKYPQRDRSTRLIGIPS